MRHHMAEAEAAVTSGGHRLSADSAGDLPDLDVSRFQEIEGPRFL